MRSITDLVAVAHCTLKLALEALRALTTVAIHWVPAHRNVFENEVADLPAKRGANGVTRGEEREREIER